MKRSKLIFLLLAVLFFIILALIAYDIARRTTFPGNNSEQPENEQIN